MQKIYLLLRNNKQTGPFSLEELIQKELKFSDLIWIEGKSVGWSNPHDMNELKSFLPQSENNITNTIETAVPKKFVAEQKSSPQFAKKFSPSKKVFISFPAGVKNIAVDEEASQDKIEKKAQELYNKIQAFNHNKEAAKESKEPEIKYTRSLSDIKNEYAQWLSEQKNKKRNFPKKSMALLATVVAIVIAGFLIFNFYKKDNLLPQQMVLQEVTPLKNEVINTGAEVTLDEQNGNKTSDAMAYNSNNEESFGDKDLPLSIENELTIIPAKAINKKDENNSNSEYSTIENEEIEQPSTQKEINKVVPQVEKTREKKIPITQLISIRHKNLPGDKKGLEPQIITLKNNSDQLLKVVAVDVNYYDRNKNKVHQETIYFSNVEPNKSITLTAPGHKKAFSAETQFGLISSEEGSLFFAKQ